MIKAEYSYAIRISYLYECQYNLIYSRQNLSEVISCAKTQLAIVLQVQQLVQKLLEMFALLQDLWEWRFPFTVSFLSRTYKN